jgi:endo-1,4-beta-xylanase
MRPRLHDIAASCLRWIFIGASVLVLISCGSSSQTSVERFTYTVKTPPDSTVQLRAAAHARGITIGAAVLTDHFSDSAYGDMLASEFSQLEPEHEMKFAVVHPRDNNDPEPYDFSRPDQLVAFAETHQMLVRGHTMLWHEALPDWIKQGRYSSSQLSDIAQDHITTVATHYRDRVYAWDVVNEAFNDDGSMRHSIWYDTPGIGFAGQGTNYIAQALTWAHNADPAALLFYNDYGAEAQNAKSNAIYAMAKDFKRRGIPLNGIGFQMHLDINAGQNQLSSLRSNLKRFSDLGLQVQITELDVRLNNGGSEQLNAQANLYHEVAKACFDTPNCTSLQTWGVTDKYSWVNWFYPGKGWALLFDQNFAKKPSYFATLDALQGQ